MTQEPHRDRLSDYTWRDPNYRPELPPGLPGDSPINSERALWLYIMKGVGILLGGAFLIVNLMYGAFELLDMLAE